MSFGAPGNAGTVEVDVVGRFDTFRRQFHDQTTRAGDSAGRSAGSAFSNGFGRKIAGIGATYLGATFGRQVIGASSDLAESVNVTGLAFGAARAEADKFGKGAAESVGLAESEARQLQAQLGNVMQGFGASQPEAVKASEALIRRAADVGSAWNASTQEVTDAIIAGYTTSTEPLRRFGVIIDEATIKQRALELGLISQGQELDKNAKRLAVTALVMEQTNNVAGDFANTQDGVANSSKTVAAIWEDTKAQLGTGLLPLLSGLLKLVRRLGPDGLKLVVVAAAGLLALVKLTQGVRALQGAFTMFSASPLLLAFTAVVLAGIAIWQNWDTIKAKASALAARFGEVWASIWGTVDHYGGKVVRFVTAIPNAIGAAFSGLANLIATPFRVAFAGVKSAWNATVGGFGFTVPSWLPFVGGKSFRVPSMAGGGVAAAPMLAMIGDAGRGNPEVVSPISLMRDTMLAALDAHAANGAGGVTVQGPLIGQVVVDGGRPADEQGEQLAKAVHRQLEKLARSKGRPFAVAGVTG